MSRKIKLGKYQHYKGDFYEVLGVAKHSNTLEESVIYQGIYYDEKHGNSPIWYLPIQEFTKNMQVNKEEVQRFKYIGN